MKKQYNNNFNNRDKNSTDKNRDDSKDDKNKRRQIGFFNTKNSKEDITSKQLSIEIKLGEVHTVNLGKQTGYRLNGIRPCLVLRKVGKTYVVLPFTKFRGKLRVSEVLVRRKQANLRHDSIIKVGQIQTISEEQILKRYGEVPKEILETVAKKIQDFYIHKLFIEIARKEVRA